MTSVDVPDPDPEVVRPASSRSRPRARPAEALPARSSGARSGCRRRASRATTSTGARRPASSSRAPAGGPRLRDRRVRADRSEPRASARRGSLSSVTLTARRRLAPDLRLGAVHRAEERVDLPEQRDHDGDHRRDPEHRHQRAPRGPRDVAEAASGRGCGRACGGRGARQRARRPDGPKADTDRLDRRHAHGPPDRAAPSPRAEAGSRAPPRAGTRPARGWSRSPAAAAGPRAGRGTGSRPRGRRPVQHATPSNAISRAEQQRPDGERGGRHAERHADADLAALGLDDAARKVECCERRAGEDQVCEDIENALVALGVL